MKKNKYQYIISKIVLINKFIHIKIKHLLNFKKKDQKFKKLGKFNQKK